MCLKGERRGRNKKKNSRLQEEEKKGGEVSNDCVLGGRVEPGRAGSGGVCRTRGSAGGLTDGGVGR